MNNEFLTICGKADRWKTRKIEPKTCVTKTSFQNAQDTHWI